MKLKSLSELKRSDPGEITLSSLPRNVMITRYAIERASAISRLVRSIHGASYEWYGFTLSTTEYPECINDIGLPVNDRNVHRYAGIGPENISLFQESLPPGTVINGWIHSHGDIDLKDFSQTDEANHQTVLDYVGSYLKKPVARREVIIDNLLLFSGESPEIADMNGGSVWIVTDRPVSNARVYETVYGSFCYGILVGDEGWHRQDIYYKTRAILTGAESVSGKEAEILPVESGRAFTAEDEAALASEIRNKINPDKKGTPR